MDRLCFNFFSLCFCIVSLIPFKIKLRSIQPDIVFGLIDNGILAIFAIFGGHFAGVAGAILGGVVGNAITDGIAGIFEGYYAEKLRLQLVPEERTMLKSAVGKMAGCLLGAGVVFGYCQPHKFLRISSLSFGGNSHPATLSLRQDENKICSYNRKLPTLTSKICLQQLGTHNCKTFLVSTRMAIWSCLVSAVHFDCSLIWNSILQGLHQANTLDSSFAILL